jgi:hypothetical protein
MALGFRRVMIISLRGSLLGGIFDGVKLMYGCQNLE